VQLRARKTQTANRLIAPCTLRPRFSSRDRRAWPRAARWRRPSAPG
jgi:hypothetical protein